MVFTFLTFFFISQFSGQDRYCLGHKQQATTGSNSFCRFFPATLFLSFLMFFYFLNVF